MQHFRTALIAERYMLKTDIAVHRRFLRIRRVFFFLCVHDIADPVDTDAGLGHFTDHPAQLPHRPDQHTVVTDKGDKLTRRHTPVQAEQDAEDHHQHNLHAGQDVRRAPEESHQPSEFHPQGCIE